MKLMFGNEFCVAIRRINTTRKQLRLRQKTVDTYREWHTPGQCSRCVVLGIKKDTVFPEI